MTFVAVAGPLIYLAEIDCLSLLSIADHLYVPETVHRELIAGGIPEGVEDLEYEITAADGSTIDASSLDPGETAALAIAAERDAVLLTDDLDARDWASENGIEVHGSIGIIALAYARGRLDRDEAVARMRELQRETRLFVTNAVVERGIELLDGGER